MDTEEKRDKLARVIDPESWDLYDDERMVKHDKLRDAFVEDSREIADRIIESGLMRSETWDSAEYIQIKKNLIDSTSRTGKCQDRQDILDGYFVHDPRCVNWPNSAIGGSSCIK